MSTKPQGLLLLLLLLVFGFGSADASIAQRLRASVAEATSTVMDTASSVSSWIQGQLSMEDEGEIGGSPSDATISLRWNHKHPQLCIACKPREGHPSPKGEECHCRLILTLEEQKHLNLKSCTKLLPNGDPKSVSSCLGTYKFKKTYKPSRTVERKAQGKYKPDSSESDA